MPLRSAPAVALVVLVLAACSPSPRGEGPGPVTVVASTNVYGSIAKAVGGELVTVRSLISDPAADPHSYESTAADAVAVADADVVVRNGGGYDEFITQLTGAAGGQRAVVDAGELAPPGATEVNEHLWYHLSTMQKLADRLAVDLGAADPASAATYTANAEAFDAEVAELITTAAAIGTARPGARVAVTEPVPGYLIEAAGLVDVTPAGFAAAVEEDVDPPAAVLAAALDLFGADPVRALIVNVQTETPTTDQVRQAAQTAGVPVVDVTETLPAGAGGYVDWMGGQIDALAAAVGRA